MCKCCKYQIMLNRNLLFRNRDISEKSYINVWPKNKKKVRRFQNMSCAINDPLFIK